MPKLPVIVIAQFFCTSLWFAGNAVFSNLTAHGSAIIQLGFITGTLSYALTQLADRYSPSKVFFISAVMAALSNLGLVIPGIETDSILAFRFLTGFFLAGIYPVGMKIAADYFEKGLGLALGFLVGALALGTSLPHLLSAFNTKLDLKFVVYTTSAMAFCGGLLIFLFVPDGPFRKQGQKLQFGQIFRPFANKTFRSAAFGYFGHMWELYTFWALVTVIVGLGYKTDRSYLLHPSNPSIWFFAVIAIGALACASSGFISKRIGSWKTAFIALFFSGCCCLLSPWFIHLPFPVFFTFMLFWGFTVVADSPVFSTLVAQNVSSSNKATALTIVTCIGFSITILSLEWVHYLISSGKISEDHIGWFLLPGPVFGLLFMLQSRKQFFTNRAYQRLKYSTAGRLFNNVFRRSSKRQLKNEIKFYSSFLSSPALIFDIGANDGHKTEAFKFLSGKVVACEPDPFNLEILKARFKNDACVIIAPVAVSDQSGISMLHIQQPGSPLNSLNPKWKDILENDLQTRWKEKIKFSGDSMEVKTTTLDILVDAYGAPDFIKIDVEGYEKKVIAGLTKAVACVTFEILLPEFMNDAFDSIDHLLNLSTAYKFNYAINETLQLEEFLDPAAIKKILSSLKTPHLEIIAKIL